MSTVIFGLGGAFHGIGIGLVQEDVNPITQGLKEGASGAALGGIMGLGIGQAGKYLDAQKLRRNNALRTQYFDDYVEGLSNDSPLGKQSIQSRELNKFRQLDNGLNDGISEGMSDSSNPLHRKQFEIIQDSNPMLDDYHTGIRSADDIITPEEAYNVNNFSGTPDWTFSDAVKARKDGLITLYSSKPLKSGGFATPSKIEAQSYAGPQGRIYETRVPLSDYALIDSIEGQYAPTEHLKYKLSRPLKYKANNYIINNRSVPELYFEPDEYAPLNSAFGTYAMQNNIKNTGLTKPQYDYYFDTYIDDLSLPHFLRLKKE